MDENIKSYRGVAKKKRLDMRDLMDDYEIYTNDLVIKEERKFQGYDYQIAKSVERIEQKITDYPIHVNKKASQQNSDPKIIFFTKKSLFTFFKSYDSLENLLIIKLKNSEKANRILDRIFSFLNLESQKNLSISCKYFYDYYYDTSKNDNLGHDINQEMKAILSNRGLSILAKLYKKKYDIPFYSRYVYNSYFKGREFITSIIDSIEITSLNLIKQLQTVNSISQDLLASRFHLSQFELSDRTEIFLWQANFKTDVINSNLYLNGKYIFSDHIEQAKFVNDELFYVITSDTYGSTICIYETYIRDLNDLSTDLDSYFDKFEKNTRPISVIRFELEKSEKENRDEDYTLKLTKNFAPSSLEILVKEEYIFILYKEESLIDMVNFRKNEFLSKAQYEKNEYKSYFFSPGGELFGMTADNAFYHFVVEYEKNGGNMKVETKKLNKKCLVSNEHGIYYAFTQFYNENRELEEYFIFPSQDSEVNGFILYSTKNQNLTPMNIGDSLAWNVNRKRLMILNHSNQLMLYDIKTQNLIFESEKIGKKRSFGRTSLVFDCFTALLLFSDKKDLEIFSVPFPLARSNFMVRKELIHTWSIKLENIVTKENFKRYDQFKFDNNFLFLRAEKTTVAIDFVTFLKIRMPCINDTFLFNQNTSKSKKKEAKPAENLAQKIPEINNYFTEEYIIERDYICYPNLLSKDEKKWSDVKEMTKHMNMNQKMHFVLKLYRSTLRKREFWKQPAGQEVDYIINKSKEYKKRVHKARAKEREVKLNV